MVVNLGPLTSFFFLPETLVCLHNPGIIVGTLCEWGTKLMESQVREANCGGDGIINFSVSLITLTVKTEEEN